MWLWRQRATEGSLMSDSDIFPDLPENVRREVLLISQRHIINDVRFLKVG